MYASVSMHVLSAQVPVYVCMFWTRQLASAPLAYLLSLREKRPMARCRCIPSLLRNAHRSFVRSFVVLLQTQHGQTKQHRPTKQASSGQTGRPVRSLFRCLACKLAVPIQVRSEGSRETSLGGRIDRWGEATAHQAQVTGNLHCTDTD